MPEKPLTIATYAAGASLAAITLVYVFGPTFFLDDEAAQSSKSARKKGIVGLHNPANDCFINSVLQTLAGLPELRTYLIRELHRRKLDGKEIYSLVEQDDEDIRPNEGKDIVERKEIKEPDWKVLGLQQGLVTAGLKQTLDALNERPIYKKTISASSFVHVLEQAFRTRISRQQQDAQEFLQIVTERLSDEYYAGRSARQKARGLKSRSHVTLREDALSHSEQAAPGLERAHGDKSDTSLDTTNNLSIDPPSTPEIQEPDDAAEEDPRFPFEGKIESQIECMHCHFKPKPSVSSFVTMTLNVPNQSSTTLNSCFDGMLKIEHIDDFRCEYCRLQHALDTAKKNLSKSPSEEQSAQLTHDIAAIEYALATDPEVTPENVTLPDVSLAPKRRITRHMRISLFPRVLAIHLSRSVWDASTSSTKNMAKVAFPETLPLGGLLDQKSYRLLGVVTHKGGHNSGHYESFRRQILPEPFSAMVTLGTQGVFSARNSPATSAMPSPSLGPAGAAAGPRYNGSAYLSASSGPPSGSGTPAKASSSSSGSLSSGSRSRKTERKSTIQIQEGDRDRLCHPHEDNEDADDVTPRSRSISERVSDRAKSIDLARQRRKIRREHSRWWRISDDKIKESRTSDVLGMQREVYLLFYEISPPGE